MAITFTGAGVASGTVATGGGQAGFQITQSLAVGDYLVILMAYDNSGGGGADPASGGLLNFVATGIGSAVSNQAGLNDPGAASAGLAVKCAVFPITAAITANTTGTVTWGGSSVATRAIAAIKVSSSLGAGASVAYRTNSGATGANGVNVTTKQQTLAHNNTEGVLMWAGYEYGAAVIGDADTFVGTWSAVYGTNVGSTTSGMAAYFQSKVTTANATQTWDPTAAVASDWITGGLVFTETVLPTVSQSAYRVYAEGSESGSTALAAENTAYSPNAISDLNMQLRMRLQETGAAAVPVTSDFTLQYAKNGGAWTDVGSNPKLLTTYPFSQYTSWVAVPNRSGQSFTGNGEKLARMAFDIHKLGSPPGTYTAALFAHSGTFGTSSVGTGTALATSTTVINGTDLGGVFGWVFFDFDSTFTLVNGTNYVMALVRSTAGDASNQVEIVYDSNAPTRPGNACTFNGSTWTAIGSTDYMTQVYTVPTTPPTNVVGHYSPAWYGSTTAIVEEQPTTQRLTAGTGSFVAAGNMTGTGVCEGVGWSVNNYVELLYGVTLKSTDLTNGDTLTFRVLRNGAVLNAYSVTPTLNVVKIPPAITQAAYQFFDDAGTESGAAALAAQDTAVTGNLSVGDGYGMVRVRLQSTSAIAIPATDDFRLQWEKNASGSWNNVLPLTTIEDYGWGNESNWATLGSTAGFTRAGQSFTGNGEALSRVGWSINKSGNPTGTLTCTLYAHTGTYGVTGVPTGAVLATSTTSIDATAIPGSGSIWAYFDFDGTYTLVNGTRYFITVNYSLTGDDVNVVIVDSDNTTSTLTGNKALYIASWSALGSEDMLIKLHTKPAGASTAIGYDNPNLTESAATTNRLTGGTGTFSAGKVSEVGNVTNVGWSGNNYTEILFSVKLIAANFANGDTLRFRVVRNGVADLTYSATPTINLTIPPKNYQELPGEALLVPSVGRASVPDPATIPATFSFVMKIKGPVATDSTSFCIASCNRQSPDGNASWRLTTYGNNHQCSFATYPTGAIGSGDWAISGGYWGGNDSNVKCLAFTYDTANGAWATKKSSDGGASYSNTSTGFGRTGPFFDSANPVWIGAEDNGTGSIWDGEIYWIELRSGLDPVGGTVLWRFDAADYPGSGTSYVDPRGKTWTLDSAAAITPKKMTVSATATVTGTDVLHAPVNYNETNRPIAITSTVTMPTSKVGNKELNLPVSIVSTVATPVDKRGNKELALGVAIVSTVTTTERNGYKQLALPVVAVSTVTMPVSTAKFRDLARPILIISTITLIDTLPVVVIGRYNGQDVYAMQFGSTPVLGFLVGGAAVIYTDDFNRANGAPGSAWTGDVNDYTILSNQLRRINGGGSGFMEFAQDLGSPDHFVEADTFPANGEYYIVVHARSSSNGQTSYMGFAHSSGDHQIGKNIGGGYATVGTVSQAITSPIKVRLAVEGSQQRLYLNDALVLTTNDTEITTGSRVGFNSSLNFAENTAYDNFRCGRL